MEKAMIEKKNNRNLFSRFALSGVRGLVGLVVVAILAFFIGALFFGGDEETVGTNAEGNNITAEASKEPTIWTCSMHPQIKLPKPGKCPICFMDLIPLESGLGDEEGPRQLRLSETAKQLAQIQTTPVTRAFAEAEIRMVGRIAYDETKFSYITAWVPGRLDRLYVDFTGITVKKGDHMVYMYSPELLAAQEELRQALSAIKALGQSAGSVLKTTAQATVDAAREKLRLYGLAEDQIREIETSGGVSDHITINAPVGGVVLHKEAQEGMYVKTGTRIYTIADLSRLWVIFEAYESDLPWLRYGQRVTFTSPSFPGETFEALVSFIDPFVDPKTRTVQVRTIVDNKDGKLKPDMFVRGLVVARVDGNGDIVDDYLAGKWISPMHPEVVKDHPGTCDVCGMDLVRAESLGYTGKAVSDKDAPLLLPASAPLITGKRAVVYVEIPNDDGPLFEGREVELGPRAGDYYVVKSGLEEGELVVVNGAFKLDSELQIRAKPSMMSPEGGAPPPGHNHGDGKTMPNMPGMTDMKAEAGSSGPIAEKAEAVEALTPVYTAYFELQMALAGDDLEKAKSSGAGIRENISKVDMSLFSRAGHDRWMQLSKQLTGTAGKVTKAGNIEDARTAFAELSSSMIALHDSFGHAENRDYYLTFCPMAMNNKGAYWLQTVDTVYNSFYGEAMLRCGEIKKPLSSGSVKGDH